MTDSGVWVNFTTLLLGGLIICIFLIADFWNKCSLRRHGIPGPMPLPLLGNILSFRKGLVQSFEVLQKKYGKVFGVHFFSRKMLIIADAGMLKEILVSQFSSFANHGPSPFPEKPMDRTVISLKDDQWRRVRNTLTPAFTGSKMKQMKAIITDCCDQLVAHFDDKRKEGTFIQCKDLYGSYSIGVVASAFFGLQVDSQKNPEDPFVKHALSVFDVSVFSWKMAIGGMFPKVKPLFAKFGLDIFPRQAMKFFIGAITKAMKLREDSQSTEGSGRRNDMLQLMMAAHKLNEKGDDRQLDKETVSISNNDSHQLSGNVEKKALTVDEILGNSLIFFLAGYETTNTALCFMSYLLATNPEIQEKVIVEIDEFTPTRESVTYEILQQMEYLDMFVHEALRMYPPATLAERIVGKDTTVNGVHFPAGITVLIPIYNVHHDPDLWEEPEKLIPERFSKTNRDKIVSQSWLPFGGGPRSCLGVRLAMMEMKFALIRLLQKFRFTTCTDTEIPPVLGKITGFSAPPNGIKLQVILRSELKGEDDNE